MEFRLKEIPWETSLLFIGWIWSGLSIFGMTLVNIVEPELYLYNFAVAVVYLSPMLVVGFKIVRDKNTKGIPLFICSGIIGLWVISLHMKMNLGLYSEFYSGRISEIFVLVVLLVALPVSFYIYARSIGCKDNENLKFLPRFAAFLGLILVVSEVSDLYNQVNAILLFSFLIVFGPVLGGVYIWEIMSKDS